MQQTTKQYKDLKIRYNRIGKIAYKIHILLVRFLSQAHNVIPEYSNSVILYKELCRFLRIM